MKFLVTGNLEETTGRRELRHGDVGKDTVIIDGDSARSTLEASDSSQVRSAERGEGVSIKPEGSVDSCEGRDTDRRHVSECHVSGPHEIGKLDNEELSIAGDVNGGCDISDLSAECRETSVVTDLNNVCSIQVDTVEGVQEGIQNCEGRAGTDILCKVKVRESREGLEENGSG